MSDPDTRERRAPAPGPVVRATIALARRIAPDRDRVWLDDLGGELAAVPIGAARLRWALAALGLALRWRFGALPRAALPTGAAIASLLALLLWSPWQPGSGPFPVPGAASTTGAVADTERFDDAANRQRTDAAGSQELAPALAAATPEAEGGGDAEVEPPVAAEAATASDVATDAASAMEAEPPAASAGNASFAAEADTAPNARAFSDATTAGTARVVRLRATASVAVRIQSLDDATTIPFAGRLETGTELRVPLPVRIDADDGGALLYALVDAATDADAAAGVAMDEMSDETLETARGNASPADPLPGERPLGPAGVAASITLEIPADPTPR